MATKKTPPASTPDSTPEPLPMPQTGGSYQRNPDGTLTKVDETEPTADAPKE